MKVLKNIYDWMSDKVHSPHAIFWLSFLFFIEAVFFIPVDPLLILFCIENYKKSFYYATIATISSVLGGLFGYVIGFAMWNGVGNNLVNLFISQESFNNIVIKYKLYQNWAVLIAGLTPIPYKVITLSAGFCKLDIVPFVLFSFIARGTRFFLLAAIIRIWQNKIKFFIDQYFNQLVLLFVLIVILSMYFFK